MASITGATVIITENSAATKRPKPKGHWSAVLIAGALGLLLLALGVPRLIAAMTTLEARAVIWDVFSGIPVPPEAMTKAAADIATAGTWAADGELAADRTWLLLRAADRVGLASESASLRAEAEDSAENGLAEAPGQPSLWLQLAYLRERRGDVPGAVAAWRMSLLSGAFVPSLMTSRTAMGGRLLGAMDADTKSMFKRHIRQTWVVAPAFVTAMRSPTEVRQLARDALKDLSDGELDRGKRIHGMSPQ